MRCNSGWNKDLDKALDRTIKILRRTPTVSKGCISQQHEDIEKGKQDE